MLEVFAIKLNLNRRIGSTTMSELLSCVEPSKEVRLNRFVREEDRLRGLFGDLLIRHQIAAQLGLANEEIEFGTNDYGKPYLKDVNNFHFNISHSGQWVVAAIDEKPVGIDIEEIQDIDLEISEHYFSPDEHDDLLKQPDSRDYFFTLWSLKESYIKILGKGLSHPLNAFSIKFLTDKEIIIKANGRPMEDIYFTRYNIDNSYKMGLCAQHNELPRHVNMLTMDELTRHFVRHYEAPRYWNQDAPARPPVVRKEVDDFWS